MDARIGKVGGKRPTFTLLGLPVVGQVLKTRSLGHGYYCIVDFGCPDEQQLIDELMEALPKDEPKRKRGQDKSESEESNAL
jgi:hypothetical protein